jgi:ATP-dependent RNA helicase RhlE
LTSFENFGLAAPIEKALVAEGYTSPTPIQTKAIPHVLAGRDLLGIAQTGTGKTAAFALPILHRLAQSQRMPRPRTTRVLVLSPTRELASQIADSFRAYGKNLRVSVSVVFGGVPIGRQERALARGVDVLVATPGRLLDLLSRRSLSLREVDMLVLDEADQMLDLGFIRDLKKIVAMLPKERQSLFFSATMPKAIAELADDFLREPEKVAVTPVATTVERVSQSVIFCAQSRKQALLAKVLNDPAVERTLVFTRTKHGADRVVRLLAKDGIEASAIHGNKSQSQRERALAAFRAGRAPILVATDIAARGIDVEGITHVINFELPNVPESYVHRIGRTARAGAAGMAISLCNDEERAYLRDIEKLTRMRVPVTAAPAGFDVGAADGRAVEAPRKGRGRSRPQPAQRSRPRQRSRRELSAGQAKQKGGARKQRAGYAGEERSSPRPLRERAPVGGEAIGWLGGRPGERASNEPLRYGEPA